MSRRIGLVAAIAGVVLLTGVLLVAPRATPLHRALGADAPGSAGAQEVGAGNSSGSGPGGRGAAKPIVAAAVHHDISRPLRSIRTAAPEPAQQDPDQNAPKPLPGRSGAIANGSRDPVLQDAPVGSATAATVVANFDGV